MSRLVIQNDGQAIKSTNFWDSDWSQRGCCYLSWHAGAARLLLPDQLLSALRDMETAQYVIVSRGPWHEMGGRDALELLFEDGTSRPYAVHLDIEQTDRTLPDSDQGAQFAVAVWTRTGEQLRLPGRYRSVRSIPCLDHWSDH